MEVISGTSSGERPFFYCDRKTRALQQQRVCGAGAQGFSSLPKPREDLCCVRVEAAGCRSGVAPTFLVATLSPMPLTSLGAVMQRLGRFGLMEDEGFARVDLWGEMDKGSEGLE